MKSENVILGAMACITALAGIHLVMNGDGSTLAVAVASISALAGVEIGKRAKE